MANYAFINHRAIELSCNKALISSRRCPPPPPPLLRGRVRLECQTPYSPHLNAPPPERLFSVLFLSPPAVGLISMHGYPAQLHLVYAQINMNDSTVIPVGDPRHDSNVNRLNESGCFPKGCAVTDAAKRAPVWARQPKPSCLLLPRIIVVISNDLFGYVSEKKMYIISFEISAFLQSQLIFTMQPELRHVNALLAIYIPPPGVVVLHCKWPKTNRLPVGRKCLGRATYRGRCVVTFCCSWCPNENQFFLIQQRPLATRRPFGDFIPARLHYGSVEWRAIKPVCAADYRDFSRCINYCGGLFFVFNRAGQWTQRRLRTRPRSPIG